MVTHSCGSPKVPVGQGQPSLLSEESSASQGLRVTRGGWGGRERPAPPEVGSQPGPARSAARLEPSLWPVLGGDADPGLEALCGGVHAFGVGFQSKQVPDGSATPVRDSVTRRGFA